MVNVSHLRAFTVVSLLAALAACADQPTEPPAAGPEPKPAPIPLGVYEITMTGLDGSDPSALSSSKAVPVAGPSEAMNPVNTGIALETVSTTLFSEGTRGQGGQRYIAVTYRVKNNTGGPLSNLTMIPIQNASTIGGSPFSNILLFNNTAASPTIAESMVPTGAVYLGDDARMRSQYPDVLQVFTEAEVAAISPLPAGTTGIFPYGFVVRNPSSAVSRTLPAAAHPNDWGGLVTFAFRYPLQSPNQASDPFTIAFQVLVVQDTETRMTESIEERQDTSGVRRLRERAIALGATTVTVLNGSDATDPFETDYPGQRQLCSVRTAGPVASPVSYITRSGFYTEIGVFPPGVSLNTCAAYYQSGTAAPGNYLMNYNVVVRSMDRYGNVRTVPADTVTLTSTDGTASMPGAAALVNGVKTLTTVYSTYGNSTLTVAGRRNRGSYSMFVNGMTRTWDGSVDTNWLTNGNWAQNRPPGSQDSVVVPGDMPNYPLLVQNTLASGLTMTPGTTVQPFINLSSFDLTINGSVDLGTTGTFSGTGRLILSGNIGTVGGGISNFSVRNMRITGQYSASSNLNVSGGRIVVQGGKLRSHGFRVRVRPS
ncbi:MAG TPA: hypothetical protein VF006_09735 [Longimicrobium sp.]